MAAGAPASEAEKSSAHTWANGQEPLLVQMLADELGVTAEAIIDFEISLFDVQKASISGPEPRRCARIAVATRTHAASACRCGIAGASPTNAFDEIAKSGDRVLDEGTVRAVPRGQNSRVRRDDELRP